VDESFYTDSNTLEIKLKATTCYGQELLKSIKIEAKEIVVEDNTCKQNTYQVVDNNPLIIELEVLSNDKLSSSKAIDLFGNKGASECALDVEEISQITFEFLDNDGNDLTG